MYLPFIPPRCPVRGTHIMQKLITRSGLFMGNECNQQFIYAVVVQKIRLFTPCYCQGSEKASSPLNGYVAVFGDQSSAHDHFQEVGVLKTAHDGNYYANVHHVFQIHTSRESMYRVPPGGPLTRSCLHDPHHRSAAQPNLAHPNVEHRQLRLLVGRT